MLMMLLAGLAGSAGAAEVDATADEAGDRSDERLLARPLPALRGQAKERQLVLADPAARPGGIHLPPGGPRAPERRPSRPPQPTQPPAPGLPVSSLRRPDARGGSPTSPRACHTPPRAPGAFDLSWEHSRQPRMPPNQLPSWHLTPPWPGVCCLLRVTDGMQRGLRPRSRPKSVPGMFTFSLCQPWRVRFWTEKDHGPGSSGHPGEPR